MSASQGMRAAAGVAAALLLYAATALAAETDAQKILAPTGKLRAALYPGTPTSILDPKESDNAANAQAGKIPKKPARHSKR